MKPININCKIRILFDIWKVDNFWIKIESVGTPFWIIIIFQKRPENQGLNR